MRGGRVVAVVVVVVVVVTGGAAVVVVVGAALAVVGRVVVGVGRASSTCASSTCALSTDLAGTEGPGSTVTHSGTGGWLPSPAPLLQPAATITRATIAATAVVRAADP